LQPCKQLHRVSISMSRRKQPTAKSTPERAGAPERAGVPNTIEKARKTSVFDISSLVSPSSTSSSFKHRMSKEDKAEFSIFEATYQKGEKAGEKSGNVYMNGKPRYGHNKVYKEKVEALLLTERLRWNDDIKKYHAKLYSYEQAVMVLQASKKVADDDEADLADVSIDQSIFKVPCINIFPLELKTKEDGTVVHTAMAGDTFPWKDKLKEAGFTACDALNGIAGARGWLSTSTDVKDLVQDFKKYGWTVNEHDGIA